MPDYLTGTRVPGREKTGEMSGENSGAEAGAPIFLCLCVSVPPSSLPNADRPRPVGTPVRWERAQHREGRAAVKFCISRQVDLFLDLFFLITKLSRCYCLGGGTVAITAVAYNFLTPEERRNTLQIGVSIGVPGPRDPGPTC
jgi:hypothetical protein